MGARSNSNNAMVGGVAMFLVSPSAPCCTNWAHSCIDMVSMPQATQHTVIDTNPRCKAGREQG